MKGMMDVTELTYFHLDSVDEVHCMYKYSSPPPPQGPGKVQYGIDVYHSSMLSDWFGAHAE